MKKYDSVIIGFGKGGKTLAGALAAAGKRVAVIERSPEMYGGTCINVGCIPSKSLVRSAALSASQGGSFEERAQRYAEAVDLEKRLVAMLREKNYHKLADNPNIDVVLGEGSFIDATHIAVSGPDGNDELEAAQVFINTGARPVIPKTPGLAESSRSYISEELLGLRELPRELAIVGGGYIGMEFASMYANFGSKVTIIQHGPDFLPREDADIAQAVLQSLKSRGIGILRETEVEKVEDGAEKTTLQLSVTGHPEELAVEAVLIATGRKPNVEGLGVEAAGIELTSRGAIKVDEALHTTAENIWAMGDVAGGLQFTYISLDDYRIVKSQVLGDGSRTTANRGAVPYSVFLDPPFSRVGLTEEEAKAQGFDVKVFKLAAAAIPKAQVLQKPVGLLKAIVDAKTGHIVGAHLFCEESYEVVNTLKMAIDAGIKYTVLRDAIYTHPTMSEALNDLFA